MSNYLKEYKVLGRNYGIEDFKSPGEHFFNGKDSYGKPRPRFLLWAGGCSIDDAKTLDEANDKLYEYICDEVLTKLRAAEEEARNYQRIVYKLDSAGRGNLAQFKIIKKGKS